jgi:two-component system response regulator
MRGSHELKSVGVLGANHRRASILLVEDNPDDADLTVRALEKNDLAKGLVIARDGAEALQLLHGTPPGGRLAPRVVLLDLNLPRIEGIEVLRRIRADERTRLLPVVVLTSSVEEADVVQGYRLGANGYVRKPVDFVAFKEAVRTLGLYWLTLNVSPVDPPRK